MARGRHYPMSDERYLDRAKAFLVEAIDVADREGDAHLVHELELEFQHFADRRASFPVMMLRMMAPGQTPECAVLVLFKRCIWRARCAEAMKEKTPAAGAGA